MKILIIDDKRQLNYFMYTMRWATNCKMNSASIAIVDTYEKGVYELTHNEYDELWLDHDLGSNKTGYDIAVILEHRAVSGLYVPPVIGCHSANPVGRKRIIQVINSIERLKLNDSQSKEI